MTNMNVQIAAHAVDKCRPPAGRLLSADLSGRPASPIPLILKFSKPGLHRRVILDKLLHFDIIQFIVCQAQLVLAGRQGAFDSFHAFDSIIYLLYRLVIVPFIRPVILAESVFEVIELFFKISDIDILVSCLFQLPPEARRTVRSIPQEPYGCYEELGAHSIHFGI